MKTLTRPEEQVLLTVHRLQNEAYSVTIKTMLEDLTNKNWSFGAVYDPLDRLEKKGLLSSSISEPTKERGGRGKRIYSLTEDGIKALIEIKKVTEAMWSGINELKLGQGK